MTTLPGIGESLLLVKKKLMEMQRNVTPLRSPEKKFCQFHDPTVQVLVPGALVLSVCIALVFLSFQTEKDASRESNTSQETP